MREDRWLADRDQAPGKVLFRTERTVRVWLQTVAHRQLLLRAVDSAHPTRLDLLFTGVDQQCLRASYDGLIVRCPTEDETAGHENDATFILESGTIRDYLSADGFGWQEDDQTKLPDHPAATAAGTAAAPPSLPPTRSPRRQRWSRVPASLARSSRTGWWPGHSPRQASNGG